MEWSETHHRQILVVQEGVRDYSIEIERISRDEIHDYVLASPSSAEGLRKLLTELHAFRISDLEEGGTVKLGRCC